MIKSREIEDATGGTKQTIRSLRKQLAEKDEVIDVLRESDRMIPYQRQPKPEPSKEGEEIRAAAAQITQQAAADELPVANYIYEVLAEKMDELEMHMRELEKKKQWYMARYQTIAMYLKETSL